jgi:Ca2+-binding RTX toxin-like protein
MPQTITISPDAGPDLAAIINAALADPDVSTVILEAGLFLIDSPIFVPSNKTLMGSGREDTVIRASQDFTVPNAQQNALIVSEEHSANITLSDFMVDAAKIFASGLRLNGVLMRFTENFLIERVDVENATGYAHYAVGNLGALLETGWVHGEPVSGRYEDIRTANSQVHFEQYWADGITLFNVHASDGDGDISTEAYFHPIVGSRNITYEQATAVGGGFLGFSLISSVLPLENISIIDSYVEITDPSQGSALISLGGLPVNGLFVENSSFIAHNYIAFRIGGVTGTATNSYFQGGVFAMEVTTAGDGTPSQFVVTDSDALGVRDATSGFGVAGVHSDQASYLSWNGGTIEARAGLMFPVSGAATLGPTTQLIGSGHDAVASFVEDAGGIAFLASENLDLAGAANLNGAILQVRFLSHRSASDTLYVREGGQIGINGGDLLFDGTIIGNITGGDAGSPLFIGFNNAATAAMAEAVLDAIYFANQSDIPLTTARLISAGLQIVGGAFTEVTASISVISMDDPASAIGDNAATTESNAVLINVLANDEDVDGLLDTVALIDGLAISPGGTITLTSGARVKLQPDSRLLYDPNDAFNALAGPESGTGYTSTIDQFTYTLSGGSSATVQILLTGVTSAEDILLGDAAANIMRPTLDGQTVRAVGGADTLYDDGLASSLQGGVDNDLYFVDDAATIVVELAGEGVDEVRTSLANFTLSPHVENLIYTGTNARFYGNGNAQNNILQGGALGDFLIAFEGEDKLRGGGGNDVLDGGAGNDILDGETGGDAMIGGAGNDTFFVDSLNDVIIEGNDPGFDRVFTSLSSYSLAAWVENLAFSGSGDFTGNGNAVGNQIMGSNWIDTLSGLGGNDRLIGFGGNDILDGGDGDDLLQGGEGSDQLTGGTGADRYRFDTNILTGDVDAISDFEHGLDRIELARAMFATIDLGALSATAFVQGTQAQHADQRIIYDAGSGSLYYDADGDGPLAQVKFASLAPQTAITAADFIII